MRMKLDHCMVTGCASDRRPLVRIGARFYCQDCAALLLGACQKPPKPTTSSDR